MDLHEAWDKALRETAIIRSRVRSLQTFGDTTVPYIFLSPSHVNVGDTVVRRGEIWIGRPSLILPPNTPQLQGFDFPEEWKEAEQTLVNLLLVRGVRLPSRYYDNRTTRLDVFEGELERAVDHYRTVLQRKEDVSTGLVTGPEECWPLPLLILVCAQVARNADQDIRGILRRLRRKPRS